MTTILFPQEPSVTVKDTSPCPMASGVVFIIGTLAITVMLVVYIRLGILNLTWTTLQETKRLLIPLLRNSLASISKPRVARAYFYLRMRKTPSSHRLQGSCSRVHDLCPFFVRSPCRSEPLLPLKARRFRP